MRAPSQSVAQRNAPLLEAIRALKAEHPLWGYRRVWSYLFYREKIEVNKKRVYRLMKENQLLVTDCRRLRAKRAAPGRSKPRAQRPNQFWGIDMTKVMLPDWGWIYLVVVLDWHSKKIVGSSVSIQSKASDWLDALDRAVKKQFPDGIREHGELSLVSDNGSQPTSEKFMKACSVLGIRQIFTSYNNPKGNADTERVMRTIKEDFVWPRDHREPMGFAAGWESWEGKYNGDFPHSTLKNLTPDEFESKYFRELETTLSSPC